jgi:hypothetical protein
MKLKSLPGRVRPAHRARRSRSPREVRPAHVPQQPPERVWSLLLPPGFPNDRR